MAPRRWIAARPCGNPDAVSEVCIDMSPAFIKGTAESLLG